MPKPQPPIVSKQAPIRAGKSAARETVAEQEPRGARRKRETRARLIEAALKLMSDKGMAAVAINEITEMADVGFGSFYNHFYSKEAIYGAVVDSVFEEFADALDRLLKDVKDPAEVIAISVRHTVLRARRDPTWGRFLIREGFSSGILERGLGQRLLRDIQKGIASKRFVKKDPLMSFIAAGGLVLATISAELQFGPEAGTDAKMIQALGLNGKNLPERSAAVLLCTLGLLPAEAEKIARKALPVVDKLSQPLPR